MRTPHVISHRMFRRFESFPTDQKGDYTTKMSSIKVDLTEVSNYEALPNAAYAVRITGAEIKTSKAGNSYISWEMTITEGEHADRKLWLNTVTTGKGAFKFEELLQALGVDTEGLSEFEPDEYIGADVTAVTEQVQSKDQSGSLKFAADGTPIMRNEIAQVLPAS